MLITIFTPTYNRATFLLKLYNSLCYQSIKEFEWVIVDDGSTDNTKEVVAEIIKNNEAKNSFKINYIEKSNGGKHTAINRGVKEAKGELFLILDSDDSLPSYALETISEKYKEIENDNSFAGVCGLMAHHNGQQIGSGLPTEIIDTDAISLRFKYHVIGDLLEVFRTDVMREFPFPEIKGERFCPEQLVWFRIAQKYKLHCFNKIVYYRDYLEGGLTDKIIKIRMKSPIASTMCYSEMLELNIPLKEKIKAAINYWRFWYCSNRKAKCPKVSYTWTILKPLGLLMHIKDRKPQIRN